MPAPAPSASNERTASTLPSGKVADACSASEVSWPRRSSLTPTTVSGLPDLTTLPDLIAGRRAAPELPMSKKSPLTPAIAPAAFAWAERPVAWPTWSAISRSVVTASSWRSTDEHLRVDPAERVELLQVTQLDAGADALGSVEQRERIGVRDAGSGERENGAGRERRAQAAGEVKVQVSCCRGGRPRREGSTTRPAGVTAGGACGRC